MGEKLNKGLKVGLASAIGLTVTPAISAYATTSEQEKPVDQNTEVKKEVPVANKDEQKDSISVGDYKEKPKEKIVVKKPKEQKQEKKQEVTKEEKKQEKKQENKENKENKEIKPNSIPQPMVLASINQKDDLDVTIGKITGKQFGNIKPSKRGKDEPYYVPGKIFSDDIFATDDNPYGVVANGNTVTLNIPFSLRSKSGSLYKIKQITVRGTEQLRPINKSMDKKDISVEDSEIKTKYGLGNLNKITDNIMSTSTGSIQVNINVKGGWKTLDKIKANLVVTLENGEEKEVPLDIPEFLITNKIDSRAPIDLYLSKSAHANEWSMHPVIHLDNYCAGQLYGTYDYIKGIEMKYRLTNDQFYFESKDPDIVVDNEKHTITFKGKYMMSTLTSFSDDFNGKLLLKVKGDIPPTGINCTIYPESCKSMIKWKTDPTYDMNINYYPHSSSVVAYPCGDWSIKQKCEHGYAYTKISDLGGKGKVTTVMVGSYGKDTVGLQCTRYFLNSVPANQKFYEFDTSIVKNMKGRLTKEELDKILASKSYNAKELLDMLNNGDKLPIIGATSITKEFDGNTLNEINTDFINYKVQEYYYVGEYSIITSDDKNVVNNLHNFYNKENDVLLDNGILLRNNGKLFEKVMRYGSESEGFAQAMSSYHESSMEVDDCKVSSSQKFGGFYNKKTEVKKNWFRKPHVLHYVPCANVTKISTYSDIGPNVYKAGSTFTIDMGRKFKLNGTPKFRNHDLDYRIDGTKLILTVKKNINFESYSNTGGSDRIENGEIEVPFQYLEYDTAPLTITALTGSPYYAYFNNELHEQYPAEEVKNSFVVQNDNILSTGHIAGEDIDGIIDMHDYICNKEKEKQSYWVMSSCLKDNYNLATTNGKSNENVIESHITSFGDGLIYYLTKSKCTDKDLQLLRSNKLTSQDIDYVKQHWIKYNRETLPNDVIAFVKNETVEGGASDEIYYLLAQKIKEGKSGFSQFKYLNSTSNTSSTSNIVEIKGPAIKHKVTVKAITTEGEVIMPETTVANKAVGTSLNFEDVVKFKIPPHYKCIRIENNGHESISSDDGLDLFSMFVKGFIPGMIGDSDDHVVFVLAPETLNDSISGVDCVTTDTKGHIIPNSKFKINGPFNTHVNTTKLKPVIPSGYKLVKTVVNGNEVSSVPNLNYADHPQHIVYVVERETGSLSVTVKSQDGKDMSRLNKSITDNTGNTYRSNMSIPSGYKIVSVTLNGKEFDDKNPIVFNNGHQDLVYTIRPIANSSVYETIKIVDDKGVYQKDYESRKKLSTEKEDSVSYVKKAYIPRNYDVTRVTINGKEQKYDQLNNDIKINYTDKDQDIVYYIKPVVCNINIKVVSTDGKDFSNLNRTLTGLRGDKTKDINVDIPEGYDLIKTTLDGQVFDTHSDVPFKEGGSELVYTISPKAHNRVMQEVDVVDDSGKVIRVYSPLRQVAEGYVGEKVRLPIEEDGMKYSVVGVTINGKNYSAKEFMRHLPEYITDSEQKIVYQIRYKKSSIYVMVKSTDGKDFSKMNYSRQGYIDDSTSDLGIKVPEGYTLVKSMFNNREYKIGTPVKFDLHPSEVVYTISPIPNNTITETVNVVDNTGKVLDVLQPTKTLSTSYIGHKENLSPYKYDTNRYTLRNVVINGKEFTPNNYTENLPKEIKDHSQTIVYNLIKNPSSVTVKTVLENGELVGKEKVINGYVGDSVSIPSNETKIGYHLTKTMLDDKNVSKESVSSVTLNTKSSTVIYTLSANPKGNVLRTVKIVNKEGNLVRMTEADKEIANGLSETTVSIPSYDFDTNLYSLKSDELNGKSIENKSNDVKLTEGSQHQVITLVQNYGDINYKTLDDTIGKTVDKSTGTISSPRGTIQNLNGKQVVPTGYRLTDITLNGKKVNLSDLNNLKSEAQVKNVIFHVSKIYNATNEMVGTDGHVFSPVTVTSTGIKGENVTSKELHVPDNYHLVRVEITNGEKSNTIKGNEFNINMIPKQFDNGNISVKYVVEINKGTAHCETIMEGSNTPIKGSVKDFEGITGTTINGMTVLLPEGYQVKEIKLNGKTSTQEEINKLTYTTGATNVQYIVTPLPNNVIVETVNVVNEKGDVVRSLETDKQLATGYLGKKENISLYNFDKDMYSFKNMTVDGNNVPYSDASLPKEIKDHAIRIVYNLTQNPSSVTVKTVDDKGQLVGEAKTINGFVGDKESIPSYNVKPGYHLEKTTLNGNSVKVEDVSTITLKPTKSEIVYTLAPNAKGIIRETVNVLDKEGHIIKTLENNKEVASGLSGLKTTVAPFKVDDMFYDLKDVTVNGVKSSNVPHEMTFTEKEQSIVINLNHKYGDIYVRTLMPDGTTVKDSNKSYNDLIGKKVNLIGAVVPKGYYVSRMYGSALEQGGCNIGTFDESYDYTGKPFENAIKDMCPGRLEQSVTYVLSKNPETKVTRTVNVINPYTGKIVKTLEDNKVIATGSIDTDATISKYDFDNNLYELKNVTLNDKEIPNQNTSIVFKSEDQKEIVNLVQRKGTVTITTVDDKGNKIGENAVINTVIGDTPKIPESNKKIGYHLSKVTVNNKEVSTEESPKVTVSGNDKVVYTLSPNDTGVVLETVNVINKDGKLVKTLVSNKQVASGLSETKANVPVYSFDKNLYTKVSSKLNDKDYQEGTPITLTEKPQTIVITLKQNYGMINVKTIEKETQKTVVNSERNIEGVVSENATGINPVVNPGYTLDSITINGKTATQNDVNKLSFKNEKQDVIYVVRKLPNNTITETVNVLSPTGQLVKTLESNKILANDYLGHKENIDLYNYDKELYTLKSVTLNGKEISYDKSKLPTEITNSAQSIVYNLIQNQSTVTVTTKTTDGKVIGTPQKVTSVIGSNVKLNGYTPKEGYHLESITVNNNKVNSPITDFTMSKNDTNIIYTLAPNEKGSIVRTVKIINPYTHEVAEVFENDKEIISGLSDTKQTLSKYYFNTSRFDLISNTLNGKAIENENQTVTLQKGVTHQIITLSQKPVKLTVSTVIGNKPVSEPEIIKAVIPSRLNIPKMKEVPGYHFEKANINRKEVRVVPNKLLLTGDVNIVYHLAPNAKSSVIRTVNVINPYTGKMVKTLINNETIATGLSGQTVNITPYDFDKNLYELKSVTLNGADYKETNSILLKDNTQKEVITLVQKKANVVTKTVLSNGTTIGKEDRKEGIVGDIVKVPSYETLKGYHLDHITVNGNMEKNIPTTHKLVGNDSIIYTLSPNDKSTIRETINVVNKEGRIIKVIENNKVISTGLIDTTYDWSFNNSIPNTNIKTIEIDGNKIDTPRKTIVYTKNGSDIVITLQMKQATIKYKTIDENGNTIPNSEGSSSIDIGSYMNMENKMVVPPNYKLTKILIDGKEATKESLKNVESVPNGRTVTFVVSKEKLKESLNSHKQPNIIINVENGNPITPPAKKEEKEIPPVKKEEKEIPPVKEEKARPRVIIKENKPAVKTEENPVVQTEELKETKPVNPIIIPTPKEISKLEDTGLETNGLVEAEGVISGLALTGVFFRIFKKKNKSK